MGFAAQHIREARNALRQLSDPIRDVIRDVGPFQARPAGDRSGVLKQCLILDQRIRERASDAELLQLALFAEALQIAGDVGLERGDERRGSEQAKANPKPPDLTRSAGLQARLAEAERLVGSGKMELPTLAQESDEVVRDRLAEDLDIGPVAADHFLMFGCLRLDILPASDMQLRAAIEMMDGQSTLLSASDVIRRGAVWRPWGTVATWYLKRWRLMRIGKQALE